MQNQTNAQDRIADALERIADELTRPGADGDTVLQDIACTLDGIWHILCGDTNDDTVLQDIVDAIETAGATTWN